MNTKLVMTSCAFLLATIGLILTFAPNETLSYFNFTESKPITLMLQLLGAMYFAFAMVNWNIITTRIGGIYNKPIAMGNFTHFLIGAIALVKSMYSNQELPVVIWVLSVFYVFFAILFWFIAFKHPLKEKEV